MTRFTPKPACNPNAVPVHPINQGPITPPTPANVNSVPRIVLAFSLASSETAAVIVGKTIEKKKPVNGRKIARLVNIPTARQITEPNAANKMDRTYPRR